MFQGRWPNLLALDPKNRLSVPARFRVGHMDQDGNTDFMVGLLQDPCLYLHTDDQHKNFLERIYRHLGDTREGRKAKTWIVSRFIPVRADAQGRITMPAQLLEGASIAKEVVLIAQESRVEVWAVEKFRELEAEVESSGIGEVLERVFAEELQQKKLLHQAQGPVGEGRASG